MTYLVIGLLLLAAFLALGHVLTRVPAATIARNARFGGLAILVGLAALLLLTGRVAALGQVMALVGHVVRQRGLFSRPGGFADVGSGEAADPGQPSITTAYLSMTLDSATGQIDGAFISGPLEGTHLDALGREQLVDALSGVADDPESVRLLETYLDRTFAGWREDHQERTRSRSAGAADAGGMSEDEAYEILGLEPGADPQAIRTAHRRLMSSIHPDRGGSTYLAAKVNLAKETLLRLHG